MKAPLRPTLKQQAKALIAKGIKSVVLIQLTQRLGTGKKTVKRWTTKDRYESAVQAQRAGVRGGTIYVLDPESIPHCDVWQVFGLHHSIKLIYTAP